MYRKNVSQVIDFTMVTTAGLADSTATLGIGMNRLIDGGSLGSCAGNLINRTQGAWQLVMASADCNGNAVGLFFTAPGDVPLMLTFPTTAADPTNAASFGITNLDSTISSRMGATPLINNLANLDSAVSSRLGAGTVLIGPGGIVGANTLQVNSVTILGDGSSTPFHV